MLLNELYDEELVEGPITDRLKRLAAAGAVAGSLGFGGYSAINAPKSPEAPVAVAQKQQTQQTDTVKQNEPQKIEKAVNPNFPKELADAGKLQPNERVSLFVKTVLPMITAENNKILTDRKRLQNDIKILQRGGKLSKEEAAWIKSMVDKYDEDNLYELLKKVDIIPPSIALAQAAIESSWGSDPKTQSSNAFFGQKSWAKSGGVEGPYGERYRAFDTPNQSISAYMTNLNTHDAYDDFRQSRAQFRKTGKPVVGLPLVPKLINYTDTGKAYPQKLASMIKGRALDQYDLPKK
jgi:Bax protein